MIFCDEGRRDALRSDSKMNHEGIILGLVGELELQDGQDRSSRKIEPTAGEKNQNKKGNKKNLRREGFICLHRRDGHRRRRDGGSPALLPRSEFCFFVFVLEQFPRLGCPVSEFRVLGAG